MRMGSPGCFVGPRHPHGLPDLIRLRFVAKLPKNRMADLDTLIADIGAGIIRGRSDHVCHIILRLVTKGAAPRFS
jgi:hypothetical protein